MAKLVTQRCEWLFFKSNRGSNLSLFPWQKCRVLAFPNASISLEKSETKHTAMLLSGSSSIFVDNSLEDTTMNPAQKSSGDWTYFSNCHCSGSTEGSTNRYFYDYLQNPVFAGGLIHGVSQKYSLKWSKYSTKTTGSLLHRAIYRSVDVKLKQGSTNNMGFRSSGSSEFEL